MTDDLTAYKCERKRCNAIAYNMRNGKAMRFNNPLRFRHWLQCNRTFLLRITKLSLKREACTCK